jgi:ribonuclease D
MHPAIHDPILVTHPNLLQQIADELMTQPIIGVDTESNSLHAYREQVCLIQFSTPEANYLVDPLALIDLSALGPVFAHSHTEKIFHAAEYDILCLKRDFGFEFENIFDTMTAARILGKKQVGLANILQQEFGILLDKRYQRANWGERPLRRELIEYAQLDTQYLIQLRTCLHDQLNEKHLRELAQEDFNRLCSCESLPTADTGPCWQISGSHDLNPQQLAVLQELCWYREQTAADLDRPLFKVISNKSLVAIASECPTNIEALSHLNGMTPYQIRRHGKAILQAVQRGLKAPPVHIQRAPKPNNHYLNRLDTLREWRKRLAAKWNVESDVILPRDLMMEIACRNPQTQDSLQDLMHCVPWRWQQFGKEILSLLT